MRTTPTLLRSFWVACLASLAFLASSAQASEVHDNQVEMTATLFAADPGSFDEVCKGLEGELTRGEDKATCQRGLSILAIGFEGKNVTWAMIAYPVSEEDIQGLRKAARARFGDPDSAKNRELTWKLPRGVMASAGYDDQFSTFVLARKMPK